MASVPLSKPLKHLLFRSPLLKGEEIKQALAWNWEQLLDLRRLWELQRQQRINNGLLPMARPPQMISDAVLDAENEPVLPRSHPFRPKPHARPPPSNPNAGLRSVRWRGES
jgi:hypothetical protein